MQPSLDVIILLLLLLLSRFNFKKRIYHTNYSKPLFNSDHFILADQHQLWHGNLHDKYFEQNSYDDPWAYNWNSILDVPLRTALIVIGFMVCTSFVKNFYNDGFGMFATI
jgi:hypothetical protein